MHQVVDQLVDGFDRLLPEPVDVGQSQSLAQAALLADDPAQPGQFAGHALVQLDDLVERVGHLAGDAGPVERQAHAWFALFQGGQGDQQLAHFGGVFRGVLKSGHRCSSRKREAEVAAATPLLGAGAYEAARVRR